MVDILHIGDGRNRTRPGEEVGSKAANMARIAALGLPVPPAFIVPIAILAVAILATYFPARRAARIQPTNALRQE